MCNTFLSTEFFLITHNKSLNTHLPTFLASKSRSPCYTYHGPYMCDCMWWFLAKLKIHWKIRPLSDSHFLDRKNCLLPPYGWGVKRKVSWVMGNRSIFFFWPNYLIGKNSVFFFNTCTGLILTTGTWLISGWRKT